MNYEALRHFADSWGLLFMALLWLTLSLSGPSVPARKSMHDDAANMIFDEDKNDV